MPVVKKRIGSRIALLVALAVLSAVVVVSGSLTFYNALEAANQKRAAVEGTAYVFASAVADHVASGDKHTILSVLRSVERVPGVLSASVYGTDGKLMASLGQQAILESDVLRSESDLWSMMTKSTFPVLVNIIKNGSTQGQLVLVTDISDLRLSFFKTMSAVLAASIVAASLGILLSVPLQRRITTPIKKLTESMQLLRQSKDYSVTIEKMRADETGVMVDSFNGLIDDIRQRDKSLRQLAYFDALTGLPNRTNFQRELEDRLPLTGDNEQTLTLALFNIDAFHVFNDAFGHTIGDAVLLSVASTLKTESPENAFVARLGGDEFGLLIGDTMTGKIAESAIARIQSTFYQPINILGMELHLTLTAGVTVLPKDTRNVGDALRFVYLATNEAKRSGPGRVVYFQSSMDETVKRETDLRNKLRNAIDNGELEVHYQPQQELKSGTIAGFEALVRWNQPALGPVSPALFIPIAERSGLISAVGDWVLRTSCTQAREWMDRGGYPYTVAVNVSPAQILQSGFVRRVQDALAAAALPPELLCLELTESVFIGRSFSTVRVVLDRLHALGVSLALDDFGTGYSSLSYLSQLPFNKLKIDRSFVSSSQDSQKRTEILRTIIHMAHSLNMSVVAEGAETLGELTLLSNLGADFVQGFVVARPMPAHKAIQFAENPQRQIA